MTSPRALLIIDPTLKSLDGHSYNYDVSVCNAARGLFSEAIIFADRAFPATHQAAPIERVLNHISMDALKKAANSLFHLRRAFGQKTAAPTLRVGNASVLPEVPAVFLQFAERLCAFDLAWSLRRIVAKRQGGLHIFIQHARIADLLAVEKIAQRSGKNLHFHLVLRQSPAFTSNSFESVGAFAKRLKKLTEGKVGYIRFYTDSEPLTKEYREFCTGRDNQFQTLPIPVLLDDIPQKTFNPAEISIAMLGAARIEKGFDALPEIIAALPRKCDGHTIKLRVQTSSDAADPRVQARSKWLQDYVAGNGLDRLPIEILAGPATREIYFSWFAQSDILLAPYISSKYVASTSGVFVEALHFLTPIITVQNTWMAQQIESARAQGLHIGEVVGQLNEIGAKTEIIAGNLTRYRQDMRTYLAYWKSFHSPQTIITMLLKP